MAAKIFILAFAAVIWKAQSQQCTGGSNFPRPFRSSFRSITAESSECLSPVTPCFPDTSICQGPSNPNIACAKFCNPKPAGATGACTLNEFSTLRPMTSCLKGNVTPLLPSRGTNIPCTETETALSSEFIGSSCLSPKQPLRPTSCCLQTCSQGLEEVSRPSACSVTENLSTKFRPIPQNVRPQCPAYGSANAEASSTVKEGISNAFRGRINSLTSSSATATSEACSSVNIEPDLFSSNTLSGLNNIGTPVSTSACSETASSLRSSFAPNIFGGYNNFVTPLSSTATSEAESSATIRSKIFNTNELGGFNKFISPGSTAACSESISSGTSYKPNVCGDYSNFLRATPETTCCTNTRPCTCIPSPASCLNNIPSAISACSESAGSANVGPAYSPNVFCGTNNFDNPLSAIATSEATSSTNVRPCNACYSNEFGCSNNLGSQISSIASSEASSSASVSPFISGGCNNFATASSEAESLLNIRLANTPYLYGDINNLVPSTCASSNADATSPVCIDPSKVLPPSLCGGLPNLAIPQNICTMETSQRCCNVEPPRLYPTSCSFTNLPNYLPVNINSIPALHCGVPDYISSPYQQNLVSSLNPMVANICELTDLISSIVPITEMVNTACPFTACYFLPEASCLPVCSGRESPVSLGQTSVSTAEACSSSGITDGNGPLSDIVSSTASSSSVSSLEPVTCVPNLPSIIETINLVPLAEVATSASSTSTSLSTIVTELNNPNTPCDDESSIVTSTSATSSSAVEVTNVLQDASEIPSCPIEASTCQGASSTSISASSASSSSSSSASSSSSSTASSSASATSVTSSTSSVTPSSLNQYQLGISPLTLEVQIPSCITPSSLSCGLFGSATESLNAINSCKLASSSLPVYELQIPSSIPAQLSCSLGSAPSNVPVLCMNLEPVPSKMSFSC